MKKKYVLIPLFCLSSTVWAADRDYTQVALNGFNADVVMSPCEAFGDAVGDTEWTLFSEVINPRGGLPQQLHGMFSDVPYTLGEFSKSCALRIGGSTKDGTLTFGQTIKAATLWVLATAVGDNNSLGATVNYADGTSDNEVVLSVGNWIANSYEGTAFWQIGRVNSAGQYGDNNVAFYECPISVGDASKEIESVTFRAIDGGDNNSYVFAITSSAEAAPATLKDKRLYFLSDSHLDTQWNWTVKTTIEQYVKNTLTQNFERFEDSASHNFAFNFEGAIKYMWAKEYYPDLYEKLKTYIADGRWNIAGGSLDASDVNIGSAESLIRNFLYGQTFYRQEFGQRGGRDVMLPDCFGFPWSLPSIAAHCGMKYFHSQKLSWSSAYAYNNLPRFARWQGVNGEEILSVLKLNAYDAHEEFRKDMSNDSGMSSEIDENLSTFGIPATIKYVGPRSDRGGGLDKETADWLSTSVDGSGELGVSIGSSTTMLDQLFHTGYDKLPVINHGLPMRAHGVGGYTSRTMLKFWNRKGELLGGEAEKASVAADWLGGLTYQKETLRDTWMRLLWHQFHDDLPGTCINEAYKYTVNDQVLAQLDFSRTLNNAVGAVARHLDTSECTEIPLVVYNPLSIDRSDIVEATIELPDDYAGIKVTDAGGNEVKSQILNHSDGKAKLIFLADVPSLGYAVFNAAPVKEALTTTDGNLTVSESGMENNRYRITINSNGDVSSVIDKAQDNRELLSAPIRLAMLFDESLSWPSWEIHGDQLQKSPREYVDGTDMQIEVAENGPLRASLKVTRKKNGSTFYQYIRLASEGSNDRIDFVNEVDWQSKERLLKAVFPLTASNSEATYDLDLGVDVNKNSTNYSTDVNNTDAHCEFLGHRWADVTDNDGTFGVSILNDSKYGWDKQKDNEIRLTLIHTPKVGTAYTYQGEQDLGLNRFTYSFFGHSGKWGAETQWEADKLNEPMVAYQTTSHHGSMGKEFGFVNVDNRNVAVKALKKGELTDKIVIRFYELTNEAQNVTATFPTDIVSAEEVNGVEETIGTADFSGNKLIFNVDRFHPKTFAISLANSSSSVSVEGANPVSRSVSLDYNIDVMSGNSNRKDADLSKAFPTELTDGTIVADGITFTLGSSVDGANNAVKCVGQTITLPTVENGRKVYLLASSLNKKGSKAIFGIADRDTTLTISYYGDKVGAWSNTTDVKKEYRKENTAFTATHLHNTSTGNDVVYDYLYMYKYALPIDNGTHSITLPNDEDVLVYAITVSDNTNDDTTPVSQIAKFLTHNDTTDPYINVEHDDPELTPSVIRASGYVNNNEKPEMAADDDTDTKWCDNSSDVKWIEYKFDTPQTITGWRVLNAGSEGENAVSSEYVLQRFVNNGWVNVAEVVDNTANSTDFVLDTPFVSTGVRLHVVKGEQNGYTARIYDFKVYGHDATKEEQTAPQIISRRPAYGFGKQTASIHSSAVSTNKKNPAYNILDSDRTTKWHYTGRVAKPWVIIDLHDIYDVSRFDIYDSKTMESYSNSDEYEIGVSLDGETFTMVASATGVKDEAVHTATLDDAVEARYVKLQVTKGGSSAARIYGFDVWGTLKRMVINESDGIVSRHKTILGSYNIKNFKETALNLIDGEKTDSTLTWNFDNKGSGTINWFLLDLENTYNISKFVIYDSQSVGSTANIKRYRVYVSDTAPTDVQMDEYYKKSSGSSAAWTRVANITSSESVKTFESTSVVTARYVKVEIPYSAVTDSAQIYEFEVYGKLVNTSISSVSDNNTISIYPSVVRQGEDIHVCSAEPTSCHVVSAAGTIVWKGIADKDGVIPTDGLLEGFYIVKAQTDREIATKKIIIWN